MSGYASRSVWTWTTVLAGFFLLVLPATGWAQNEEPSHPEQAAGSHVTGVVEDAESETPLAGVNVFLANTTFGASTDSTGRFRMPAVPPGEYQLVASMVGYQPKRTHLTLEAHSRRSVSITLSPRTVELDSVTVRAEPPTRWKKRLQIFERELLGQTPNGTAASIENPEMIRFSKEGSQLSATASEPLVIENPRLGYRITVVLNRFTYSPESGLIRYRAWPYFEQLGGLRDPITESQRRRRRGAYYGSLPHFLRALSRKELRDEGFYVKPDPTGEGIRSTVPVYPLEFRALSTDQLVERLSGTPYSILTFGQPFRIIYTGHDADPSESKDLPLISQIVPETNTVRFHEDGYFTDSYSVTINGYMGQQRLADLVPYGYEPGGASRQTARAPASSTDTTGIVRGLVRAENGSPVPGANVFPANTTFGSMTDTTGRFRFEVPAGPHTLIVSAVGYEDYSSSIEVPPGGDVTVTPTLSETTYELPEVRARADQGNWPELYRRFRTAFLGHSRNAGETVIANKYAVGFNRSGDMLEASSETPLRLVNCGLGYLTTFHLGRFVWEMGTANVKMGGWPQHAPLETLPDTTRCEANLEKWEERRLATYRGSMRHFLQAVADGTLDDQEFYIQKTQRVDSEELADTQPQSRSSTRGNPSGFSSFFQSRNTASFLRSNTLPVDSIRSEPTNGEYQLAFENYLRVRHVPDRSTTIFNRRLDVETSWIRLHKDSVAVSTGGRVLEPYALTAMGWWTNWRIADQLPYDYSP